MIYLILGLVIGFAAGTFFGKTMIGKGKKALK